MKSGIAVVNNRGIIAYPPFFRSVILRARLQCDLQAAAARRDRALSSPPCLPATLPLSPRRTSPRCAGRRVRPPFAATRRAGSKTCDFPGCARVAFLFQAAENSADGGVFQGTVELFADLFGRHVAEPPDNGKDVALEFSQLYRIVIG